MTRASRAGSRRRTLSIPLVEDFAVDGTGRAPAWRRARWNRMQRLGGPLGHRTRCKLLWSRRGLYVLWDCQDRRIDCTLQRDLADLFTEDVAELFLWTCEDHPVYLEYEISPLGHHLPLVVTNDGRGRFHGWLAWKEEGPRGVRRATAVRGGAKAPGAACRGWSAEVFIPFRLMHGLVDGRPQPGTRWRGNIYRIDIAGKKPTHWAWSPVSGVSFHNYREFGELVFAR